VRRLLKEWRKGKRKENDYKREYNELCERKKKEENERWERKAGEARLQGQVLGLINKERKKKRVNGNIKIEY